MKRTIITLSIIAIVGLTLRILPHLISPGYADTDCYYHLRLVELVLNNHFQFPAIDAYAVYPGPWQVDIQPFFAWMTAGIIWVLGLGHPSASLITWVTYILPAVIGAITLVPVYFLGKHVFNKPVGILGAVLVAIVPTEFFARSSLGFYDYHVLEVLLTTSAILFLVLYFKEFQFHYLALAVLMVVIYAFTWKGWPFLLLIIGVWVLVKTYQTIFKMEKSEERTWGILGEKSTKVVITALLSLAILSIGFVIFLKYPSIVAQFTDVFWGFGSTNGEVRPIDPAIFILHFGFLIVFVGYGVYLMFKNKGNSLFLVWTIVLIVTTICARRWEYYLAIPLCITGAYAIHTFLTGIQVSGRKLATGILTFMCVATALPILLALSFASPLLTNDWQQSLTWLKDNSPDPFNQYVAAEQDIPGMTEKAKLISIKTGYLTPEPYAIYQFPLGDGQDSYDGGFYFTENLQPSYAVLAWWDYGYWITGISQRIPLANSGLQKSEAVSKFLVAQSPKAADDAIQGLKIKYVIVSFEDIDWKWYAIVKQAGYKSSDEFALRETSMAYQLYYTSSEYGGYRLVHSEGIVKIFEKID